MRSRPAGSAKFPETTPRPRGTADSTRSLFLAMSLLSATLSLAFFGYALCLGISEAAIPWAISQTALVLSILLGEGWRN